MGPSHGNGRQGASMSSMNRMSKRSARRRCWIGLLAWAAAGGAAWGGDVFWAGRTLGDDRDARINLELGTIVEMKGYVQETTRALYSVTGNTYKNDDAGRLDLNDFDVNGGTDLIGLSFEKAWTYITVDGKVMAMHPETDAVAQRNYYLSVAGVEFNGIDYDHIKIPEGTPFHAEMEGALFEFDTLVTPVTIWMSETARFTPGVGLGLFGLAGTYDIDAGPATGIVQYQNPLEDFVVGGHASGSFAGGLPELVGGGELEFGEDEGVHVAVQGYAGWFGYSGGSGYFTSADQDYEKHADIDHLRLRARALVDIPLGNGPELSLGASYEVIDTSGMLKQDATTDEEILARQERFDKKVDFQMTMATVFVGLAF